MDIRVKCGENLILKKAYKVMSSKSVAHRALICAAFSDMPTKLLCEGYGDDVRCTAEALRTLGAEIDEKEYGFFVRPIVREFIPLVQEEAISPDGGKTEILYNQGDNATDEATDDTAGIHKLAGIKEGTKITIDCGSSASTYRFMNEICKELGIDYELTGTPRLLERVHSTSFTSQTMSGMLMAFGLRPGLEEFEIECPSIMPSQPYVMLTMKVMEDFGLSGYESPSEYEVEGDWSQAAYYMAIGATNCHERKGKALAYDNSIAREEKHKDSEMLTEGKPVKVTGLDTESVQGDREFVEILRSFGAIIMSSSDAVSVKPFELKGADVDMLQTPDLLPITAVVAAQAQGDSILYNVGHLRYKESDRVKTTIDMINSLGGSAEFDKGRNAIIIHGMGDKLRGGTVESCGDHRIAMAGAVAAFGSYGEVIIRDAGCVSKSCPGFWEELGV